MADIRSFFGVKPAVKKPTESSVTPKSQASPLKKTGNISAEATAKNASKAKSYTTPPTEAEVNDILIILIRNDNLLLLDW